MVKALLASCRPANSLPQARSAGHCPECRLPTSCTSSTMPCSILEPFKLMAGWESQALLPLLSSAREDPPRCHQCDTRGITPPSGRTVTAACAVPVSFLWLMAFFFLTGWRSNRGGGGGNCWPYPTSSTNLKYSMYLVLIEGQYGTTSAKTNILSMEVHIRKKSLLCCQNYSEINTEHFNFFQIKEFIVIV